MDNVSRSESGELTYQPQGQRLGPGHDLRFVDDLSRRFDTGSANQVRVEGCVSLEHTPIAFKYIAVMRIKAHAANSGA